MLAARLGHTNRAWLADLRGEAPIVGCGRDRADTDVPGGVIDAAGLPPTAAIDVIGLVRSFPIRAARRRGR